MPVFGIETEPSGIVDTYIEDTRERLGPKAKTPFYSGEIYKHGNKYFFYLTMNYPPLHYFGIITLLSAWVFNNGWIRGPAIVLSCILFTPLLFKSKLLFITLLKIGLRKHGYKDKIIIL